ncbi:DUF3068 domain-containing protein [Gordonia sp. NPDC003424]
MSAPRLSTSDLIGPALIFLGGFLLAVAIALPTLFVDTLRTIPLSTDVTTTAPSTTVDAAPARILDRCSLKESSARVVQTELTRQQRFVAVQPSDANRVTLQAGTSVRVDGDGACTDPTISAVRDRVTLDRTTALPALAGGGSGTPGSSEIQYDSGSPPVPAPDRRGYTYLLPFDTASSDRLFFDVTTRRTVPLRFTGDTTVHGHDAARFTADVPDTDLHTLGNGDAQTTPPTIITRPASWFGVPGVDPARMLTATLHHSGRWVLAVDTATGTILDERITVVEEYRFIDTALPDHRVTYLSATFAYDDKTQRAQVRRATALASPVTVWGRVIPIIAAVAGVAAIVIGLTPWRRRRRPAPG